MIKLGEKIKSLRKNKNISQEILADYLGVSFQAVSKWENGSTMPDVTMIPVLASFFGVTTDYLLSFDDIEMEKEIEEYISLYYQLWQNRDYEAVAEKMKEAIRRYPSEYRLLVRYLNAMTWASNFSVERALSLKNEIVAIYERICDYCTDDSIRMWAKKLMCKYYKRLSAVDGSGVILEDAVKILNEMPLMQNARDYLCCSIFDGDEKNSACKNAICELVFLLNNAVSENWAQNYTHSAEESIEALEAIVAINKIVYSNGDYGKNYINAAYMLARLGSLHKKIGNDKKANAYINESLKIAKEFDYAEEEICHSSGLLAGVNVEKSKIPMAQGMSLENRIKEYLEKKGN